MSPVDADGATTLRSAARRVYDNTDLRIAIFEYCDFDFLKSTGIILNQRGFETAVARLWRVVVSVALEQNWRPNARGPRQLLLEKRFFSLSLHDLDLCAVQARYPSLLEFSVWHEDSPMDLQSRRSIFRWVATDRLWDHMREHRWVIDLGDPDIDWCLFALDESIPPAWREVPGARGAGLTVYIEISGQSLTDHSERLFGSLAQCPARLQLRLLGSEKDLDSFEDLIDQLVHAVAKRKANSLPDILDFAMRWTEGSSSDDDDDDNDDTYWLYRPLFNPERLFTGLGSTLTSLSLYGKLKPTHLQQLLSAVEEHCTVLQHVVICLHLPYLANDDHDEGEGQALMPNGTRGRILSFDVWCFYEPTLYGYDFDTVDWRDFDRELFAVLSSLARLVCFDCSLTFAVGETEFDLSEASQLLQSATFACSYDEMRMGCCAPARSREHLQLKQMLDGKLDDVWDAIREDWETIVMKGGVAALAEAGSEASDGTTVIQ